MELMTVMAATAQAVNEQRTPFSYSFLTYLWVLMLSGVGGLISFLRKIDSGNSRPFNLVEFVGEMTTSAFVGLLTFWLCEWAKVDPMLSAVFIAITGHMGSRALFAFEKFLERWFYNKYGIDADAPHEHKRDGDK